MFNVISGRDADAYIDGIRKAFAAIDVYRPAGTGNVIVFASADEALPDVNELRARAQTFDQRGGYGFSFERLLEARERPACGSGAGPGAALRPGCSG